MSYTIPPISSGSHYANLNTIAVTAVSSYDNTVKFSSEAEFCMNSLRQVEYAND
jgi:hypothetical protein